MSEESHNSSIGPELEARIVALVLGEASDFERDELYRLIEQRPELAAFRLQMQEVHGLLQDVGAGEFQPPDDDWKLPTERRSLVLAVIRGEATVPPANQAVRYSVPQRISGILKRKLKWNLRWSVATVAAAVCVAGFLGIMLLPYFRDFESMLAARWRPRNAKFTAVGGSLDGFVDAHVAQDQLSLKRQTDVDFWFGAESAARDVEEQRSERLARGDFGGEKDAASALSAIQDALNSKAPGLESERRAAWIMMEKARLNRQIAANDDLREKKQNTFYPALNDVDIATVNQNGRLSEGGQSSAVSGNGGVLPTPGADQDGDGDGLGESDLAAANTGELAFPDLVENGGDSSESARAGTDRRRTQAVYGNSDLFGAVDAPASGANAPTGGGRAPQTPGASRDLAKSDEEPWFRKLHQDPARRRGDLEIERNLETEPMLANDGAGSGAAGGKSDGEQLGREAKSLDDVSILGNTREGISLGDHSSDLDIASKELSDLSRKTDDGTSAVARNNDGLDSSRPGKGGLGGGLGAIGGAPPGEPSVEPAEARPAIRRDWVEFSDEDVAGPSQVAVAGRPTGRKSEVASDSAPKQLPESLQEATPQQSDQKPGGEGFMESRSGGVPLTLGQRMTINLSLPGIVAPSGGTADDLRRTLSREQQLEEQRASVEEKLVPAKNPAGKPVAPPAGLDEKTAAEEAFSTFSLHVSDVSFKLAAAALARGEWPEAAKIRIEEFVNAFDYSDPLPSGREKVACRVEQSIHPFVQQRNLLRISMRTTAEGRANNTPLRLTLLLDNSGSMERTDRRETVRRAFALLARQLSPVDQVTLISFARQPRLLAEKVSGAESGQLVRLIDELPSEGGTNIEAALQLAIEKATQQQTPGAQNRIILLTDGAVNLGDADPESLSQIVTTMRDAGIAFDAAGISAEGLNDEVLEALTRRGDGRYYLLDSAEAADDSFARQVAGALRPSASNVKVQVEFNPKRVGHYKLLGFEKHILQQEDFRNDAVDAAEMAAAEAGVAVYQFEPMPDGEGDVGSVSVRFRDLSTGQMVENRWPVPYEAGAPRPDQAAPSLRIATSAALLAAKLRGEPLGETVDLQSLSQLISGLPVENQQNARVQQLKLMIEQARQMSGK